MLRNLTAIVKRAARRAKNTASRDISEKRHIFISIGAGVPIVILFDVSCWQLTYIGGIIARAVLTLATIAFAFLLLRFSENMARETKPIWGFVSFALLALVYVLILFGTKSMIEANVCIIGTEGGQSSSGVTGHETELAPTEAQAETINVAITEIMLVPRVSTGKLENEFWNEYIEIYNYGNSPIDTKDLWLATSRSSIGQTIIPWSDRFDFRVGEKRLVYDSTIIPPNGVALFYLRAM